MMVYMVRYIQIITVCMTIANIALAQSKKSDAPKRTTINFEDQLITGQNQKPDLLYLLQKKQFNYKRLIRLREDFLPEMRETATEIEEGRRVRLQKSGKE